jgi:uncharacterized protein (DUF2236 family)
VPTGHLSLPAVTSLLSGSEPGWAHEGDPGLFGPGTVTWEVYREPALLLGAGRALLMQVAHPSVATGVAQHSDFPAGAWRRLLRTLDVVARITFGDSPTSERAAHGLRTVHRSVRGARPDGASYRAQDPDLLLWVWATLVESTALVYGMFIRPLTAEEMERFYSEQQRFARVSGVPEGYWPASYGAFRDYVEASIEQRLRVTPEAKEIAASVLIPPLPTPVALAARPSLELLKLTTTGLLPPSLRRQYDLGWGPVREALFRATTQSIRRSIAVLPGILTQPPYAGRRFVAQPAG